MANEDEHDDEEHDEDDDDEEDDEEDEDFSHNSEWITGLNADVLLDSECRGIFTFVSSCCIENKIKKSKLEN